MKLWKVRTEKHTWSSIDVHEEETLEMYKKHSLDREERMELTMLMREFGPDKVRRSVVSNWDSGDLIET